MREDVGVAVGETEVSIFFGSALVAQHARCTEPHAEIRNPEHFAGLHREPTAVEEPIPATLEALGRSLADYDAVIGQEPA